MYALLLFLFLFTPDAGKLSPDSAKPSPLPSPVTARVRVYVFAPQWCSICKTAKWESTEQIEFVLLTDEDIFPEWVRKKPSPVLFWRINKTSWSVTGWQGMKHFEEVLAWSVEHTAMKERTAK